MTIITIAAAAGREYRKYSYSLVRFTPCCSAFSYHRNASPDLRSPLIRMLHTASRRQTWG